LTPSRPLRVSVETNALEPPRDFSPWDLPPDLYERWEERVCIMHFDGGLPWPQAEAEALADVLRLAGPDAGRGDSKREKAEAAMVQGSLFAVEPGPYRGGL
jgi:hypothetical protein